MTEFEKYVPKPPSKDGDSRLNLNLFTEGNRTKKGPDYRLVYGKDIEGTAYDKPGIRSYNMDVVDLRGNTEYTGGRRDYTYQVPSEDYGKPPGVRTSNSTDIHRNLSTIKDSFTGFGFDTTSLEHFRGSVAGMKSYIVQSFGIASPEYKEFEKNIIFILSDMQRVWAGDGNYNKNIIPTAGKVGTIVALKNSLIQLGKSIPSDETMYNQWSLGNNPEKVICRDFAIVSARIGKSLGFEAVAGTIEVGVSHAFTTFRSKETGEYYAISADAVGGPAKIFQGKSLAEIRSSYQNHLISIGRAQHFGGVFLDDTGKVLGKWQTDLEKRRAKDFLGGDMPSRLLSQSLETDISLNKGTIGGVDYMSLIAQKGTAISGDIIDTELFWRGALSRMSYGESGANAVDIGVGTKISSKPIEISSGFTARVYIAADINMSVGFSGDKGTQIPYLSGNSIVGGQMKYIDKKWVFTTDIGKAYELSGPNQMQYPLMKLLPSGEYAIFTGEYKGESMNILGRAVMENYFTSQRRELSLGIRTNSGYMGSVFQRNTKDSVPGFPTDMTRETGIGVGGMINSSTNWRLEGSRKKGPPGPSHSINAGIDIKF